jgi:hypothetical protein
MLRDLHLPSGGVYRRAAVAVVVVTQFVTQVCALAQLRDLLGVNYLP